MLKPVLCKRCGAAFGDWDHTNGYLGCMCCDGEVEQIEWHEYATKLLEYYPERHHSAIKRLAGDLFAEHEKTRKYLDLMSTKKGFDANGIAETVNRNAYAIVSNFEDCLNNA